MAFDGDLRKRSIPADRPSDSCILLQMCCLTNLTHLCECDITAHIIVKLGNTNSLVLSRIILGVKLDNWLLFWSWYLSNRDCDCGLGNYMWREQRA